MPISTELALNVTRRHFFRDCAVGAGKIALASLLTDALRPRSAMADSPATVDRANPMAARPTHFAPRAKSVVHLFMAGAPSHLDLFDYKPALARFEGKPIPPEIIAGQRYAFIRSDAAALGPRFKFAKHGQCGAELAEVLPHLATVVDDICIVKSLET